MFENDPHPDFTWMPRPIHSYTTKTHHVRRFILLFAQNFGRFTQLWNFFALKYFLSSSRNVFFEKPAKKLGRLAGSEARKYTRERIQNSIHHTILFKTWRIFSTWHGRLFVFSAWNGQDRDYFPILQNKILKIILVRFGLSSRAKVSEYTHCLWSILAGKLWLGSPQFRPPIKWMMCPKAWRKWSGLTRVAVMCCTWPDVESRKLSLLRFQFIDICRITSRTRSVKRKTINIWCIVSKIYRKMEYYDI